MDKYYKMCVAAGLNYYRKVPDIVQLQRLSGQSIYEFFSNYRAYETAHQLSHSIFGCPSEDSPLEIALKMIMTHKGNFVWSGKKWVTNEEAINILKDHPAELRKMFSGVAR